MTIFKHDPAFPIGHYYGMTIRDYFAIQILNGVIASQDVRNDGKGTGLITDELRVAKACYSFADKMLEARQIEEESSDH